MAQVGVVCRGGSAAADAIGGRATGARLARWVSSLSGRWQQMALPEGVTRQGGVSFSQIAPGCQGQRPAKAQAWVGEGGFRGWSPRPG